MRRVRRGRLLQSWSGLAGMALVLAGSCTGARAESEASAARELDGAWRMVASETIGPDGTRYPGTVHESLLLMADGYYSMNWAFGPRKGEFYSTRFKPTDAEALARYRSLLVNAGRFEIAGDVLTIHPEFALVPEFIGGVGEFDYALGGENLELTWRKIEAADGKPDPNTEAGVRYVSRWQRVSGGR